MSVGARMFLDECIYNRYQKESMIKVLETLLDIKSCLILQSNKLDVCCGVNGVVFFIYVGKDSITINNITPKKEEDLELWRSRSEFLIEDSVVMKCLSEMMRVAAGNGR